MKPKHWELIRLKKCSVLGCDTSPLYQRSSARASERCRGNEKSQSRRGTEMLSDVVLREDSGRDLSVTDSSIKLVSGLRNADYRRSLVRKLPSGRFSLVRDRRTRRLDRPIGPGPSPAAPPGEGRVAANRGPRCRQVAHSGSSARILWGKVRAPPRPPPLPALAALLRSAPLAFQLRFGEARIADRPAAGVWQPAPLPRFEQTSPSRLPRT